MVTLLTYMTGRSSTISAGPTAYTWYDELIVSSNPSLHPTTENTSKRFNVSASGVKALVTGRGLHRSGHVSVTRAVALVPRYQRIG